MRSYPMKIHRIRPYFEDHKRIKPSDYIEKYSPHFPFRNKFNLQIDILLRSQASTLKLNNTMIQ